MVRHVSAAAVILALGACSRQPATSKPAPAQASVEAAPDRGIAGRAGYTLPDDWQSPPPGVPDPRLEGGGALRGLVEALRDAGDVRNVRPGSAAAQRENLHGEKKLATGYFLLDLQPATLRGLSVHLDRPTGVEVARYPPATKLELVEGRHTLFFVGDQLFEPVKLDADVVAGTTTMGTVDLTEHMKR